MYKITVNIKRGFFALEIRNKTIGHVTVAIDGNKLKILDTVVLVGRYLPLIGKLLLQGVVKYARLHELKIVTVSKFAQEQFSRDPAPYADVWERI